MENDKQPLLKQQPRLKRLSESALDKVPEVVIASVVAIGIFSFNLWVDVRDSKSVLERVVLGYGRPEFCERVKDCRAFSELQPEIDRAIAYSRQAVAEAVSHSREAEVWKRRIEKLEDVQLSLSTMPSARPDPFTGSDARDMRGHLEAEIMKLREELEAVKAGKTTGKKR